MRNNYCYLFKPSFKLWIITLVLGCSVYGSYANTNIEEYNRAFNISDAILIDDDLIFVNDCTNVEEWSSGSTYTEGDEVQLNGNKYLANWWTQDNPETNNGPTGSGQPWTLQGPCGDPNQAPVVNITSPGDGTSFDQGDSIAISASASDADGVVSQVEFFAGAISIGVDNASPYNVNWTNANVGNHTITAVAMDNDGETTTSVAISITVNQVGPPPPVVSITSPANNASFVVGTDITITASASDANGTVTLVEFFQGTTKLGQDTTAPYSFTWSGAPQGTYSLTAVATDNDGATTTSTPVSVRVRNGGGSGGELPNRVIVGYWHNFDNGSGFIRPENVSSKFDVVNISFAEPVSGSTSLIDFTPDPANISDADFRAGIEALQSRGQEVVISIGGANGTVQLNTIAERDEFVNSMISIIEDYGFDGMDIDFEGQSLSLNLGDDDFRNPTTPLIVNLIDAINTIYDHFGNNFVLTMAPETFFVQLGYTFYGGISAAADRRAGAYLPVIHALRDRLSFLQVQYYNSGSITALDDQFYAMGNADFYVSLVDMLLKGFPITGDPSKFFPALRQDQVLIGLPANFNAGGGFAPPAEVHKALDYLIKGIPFGGNYTLSETYPNLRGLMTWSVNWDAFNNFEFSNEHRAYLDALDGGNPPPVASITAPSNNANFVIGDVVTISANASDNGSVTQVEFFVDGASVGIDTTSPYSITWNAATAGTHSITATATDNEGTTGTSGTVSINVTDTSNEVPTVSISSPSAGATFDQGTPIIISANATDSDGTIAQVEFFAGGVSLGADTSEPFSVTWNNAGTGTQSLIAVATDNLGATGNSTAVEITVQIVVGEGCTGIPIWSASATYTQGDEVQLNNNKYVANWWTQSNPETDNGPVGSGRSWTLLGSCSTDTNQPPTINITSPSPGSTFVEGTTIQIVADATDDGTVTQVEFMVDGASLGVDTTSPYSFDWTGGSVGEHSITAIATDNNNATTTSAAVSVSITAIPSTLSVSLTSPSSGSTFMLGNNISLTADASDTAGNVTLVEFFDGSTKIGEDTTAPYGITWSSGSLGNHSLTAKATNNTNDQVTSSVVNISITSDGTPGSDLAKHIMVGYWHNFDNGSAVLHLGDVSTDWDVVNIAFAEPATFGQADMAFVPNNDVTTEARFRQDVALLQSRGQKVLISIGGANGRIELLTPEDAQTFATAMISIIEDYGFDGMDIDLEGTSLGLSTGDNDFRNPTSPKITNFITGTEVILNHFGPDFILSAAPETAFVQGGNSTYAGSFGAYLPVIYKFRDRLDYIHVQDYNSGCMLGLDGVCYSQGTADFHVAMTEMLLQGFSVAGHSVGFPALRPDQVAFGIPASPQAAGGGYTTPTEVKKALDYLIKGISFGGNYTLVNSGGYPEMRGLMTWSINWDEFFNKEFSLNYRPYFDALLGGSKAKEIINKKIAFDAFPNPVSTTANFRFDLQQDASVTLEIYNVLGKRIKTLSNSSLKAGSHKYEWDTSVYSKGIYLIELKINGVPQVKKILKN
ncbi:Ig-like domain-containing protein [Aquimarina sp. 2201CG5-10]|uniref:Ig-like domain-containing protein n=1 Tax=Aquimarina callyspongiae TaxID=3098150 RepID=UPI002AB4DE09|nr:Ig-like domain-containing protein [Aquimarina sp. 2201CG5-10]MDY8134515.1 Ig-like domain-containing protein [Aquimarina sp. 2201CG5-10]